MVVPPAEPDATADLGPPEAGSARKLRLDEMLAERDSAPLPPAPVLTLHPVPVDAAPVGSSRRAALKRLAEVEALARTNLRAAEEAQRVVQQERELLEEEASARTRAERTAASLRTELERLRSTEEQRAAQAQFAATHQARSELAGEMERVHNEHAHVVDELDRMRGTLLDHDSLLDEYSHRLHDEQEAQASARADLLRAQELQRIAERNLEIATETARRRAEDDHARLVKVDDELRDAIITRDRATAELLTLTTGDGEIARLRARAEADHEDMTRLLADLDVQAARADKAEAELATSRAACSEAEQVAAEAVQARDLDGIALETTRSELARRTEELDQERTAAQTRVADLGAQLVTITRTAESATARVDELEAQLAGAVAARDEAVAHAAESADQLQHAVAAADELRTHAVSIGDELAASHASLEQVRSEIEELRSQLTEARRPVEAPLAPVSEPLFEPVAFEPVAFEPVADVPAADIPLSGGPSAFDAAITSAFRETLNPPDPDTTVPDADPSSSEPAFRTVESNLARTPAGGPVIEREAALLRQIAPSDPEPAAEDDDAKGEPQPEPESWRRTAMAEFSSLANSSDDLTPRRRR